MQDLTETTEDPGVYHRGTMQDLAMGLCGVRFILACVLAIVVYARKRRELVELRAESRPSPDVIDAEIVSTALVGPTHHVDGRGRKVCSGCGGYSPEWHRARTLVLVQGAIGWTRERLRAPPAWRTADVFDAPQDVCTRCRIVEGHELAAEIEERHRLHERTTSEVMTRHAKWSEGFRDAIREKAGGARRWRSTADTF